jgi:two-component system, OmpR family, KDP operon response regulator KdpE
LVLSAGNTGKTKSTEGKLFKILLIDDDPTIIILIENMLLRKQPSEFEVIKIYSGAEGVEATRQFEPDVVVLDLMMPGVSGWDVIKKIRAFSQVPIIVFSAVIDSELVLQALDAGANDYLVKPVPGSLLVSRIKRLLHL